MKLLLDTHIFIWAFSQPSRLSQTVQDAIALPQNELFLSVASSWEMQIKEQIGKLTLLPSAELFVKSQMLLNHIQTLPIRNEHVWILKQLPLHHRDPFDRLMIAQAIAEELTIVSVDRQFEQYRIPRLF